ncbi:tellurite resistance TerB family protein [Aliamphritea spongicola]|uniref:tellurite resistance TerB family protein n=1 Tax=Aliamphritea spongicola TaxID=707589 RepID=UPI00196B7957|nr:TerB family tellurite resistance protein [Aliamphritea spongicola]MBN3563278.1 TerB family tellurite resistance protein [Aliamphritea spongicola]
MNIKDKIKHFFTQELSVSDTPDTADRLQLAAATLLIELSKADYKRDPKEQEAIEAALNKCFDLDPEQLSKVIELAEQQSNDLTSLYPFTSLVTDNYGPEERFELVKMLWQVAAADGEISKFEDHLIRRIADLIHLPHGEFIRAKLAVLEPKDL